MKLKEGEGGEQPPITGKGGVGGGGSSPLRPPGGNRAAEGVSR